VRGIELRQRNTSLLVKLFQQRIIDYMKACDTKQAIQQQIPALGKVLRDVLSNMNNMDPANMHIKIRISKLEYTHNVPQKAIVKQLQQSGRSILPGQYVSYIMSDQGPVLPQQYRGTYNYEYYRKLLVRSLFILLQPFGVSKQDINAYSLPDRQTVLADYPDAITHRYIPMHRHYPKRKGLSERIIRRQLEKQGWQVWRGGLFNVLKRDPYPNVQKRYTYLFSLMDKVHPNKRQELEYLCQVHHGMPDLLCYKDGHFRFVECKLGHEQLSQRQKACLTKLQRLGFDVQVYKLVDHCTKVRKAHVDIQRGRKVVIEKQQRLYTTR
jgi:hypothetical protein